MTDSSEKVNSSVIYEYRSIASECNGLGQIWPTTRRTNISIEGQNNTTYGLYVIQSSYLHILRRSSMTITRAVLFLTETHICIKRCFQFQRWENQFEKLRGERVKFCDISGRFFQRDALNGYYYYYYNCIVLLFIVLLFIFFESPERFHRASICTKNLHSGPRPHDYRQTVPGFINNIR